MISNYNYLKNEPNLKESNFQANINLFLTIYKITLLKVSIKIELLKTNFLKIILLKVG